MPGKITGEILEKLKEYGCASWAIWPDDFGSKNFSWGYDGLCCYNFMRKNLSKLKPSPIFLGLNPSSGKKGKSNEEPRPFCGFHMAKHQGDKALKEIIQDGKLENLVGGYMTDLYSIDASSAYELENKPQLDKPRERKLFEKQLEILNQKRYDVICLGNKVFDELKEGYGGKDMSDEVGYGDKLKALNIRYMEIKMPRSESGQVNNPKFVLDVYRVRHHSQRAYIKQRGKELECQLKVLNEIIGSKAQAQERAGS